jgi:RNA 2',3'-cyclic 3'-phosphodiesterase
VPRSGGATARLFVAVDLPAAVCEHLAAWAREAAAGLELGSAPFPLRLLNRDVLHLTLCFLGSRPVEEITAIGSALQACTAHMGELSVGPPLWLPPARPRSLAVAIHDDDGALANLHTAVTNALSETIAWKPERRRFRAHVTLARTRGRPPEGWNLPGASSPLPATPQLRFAAESLTLYRSWLAPEGASYEALASCELSAWA